MTRLFFTTMPIVWTQNEAANQLLEEDPLALLIGLVLDQQVKMEKAFGGPYELKQRLGHLDAAKTVGVRPPGWEAQAAQWHTVADVDSAESMAEARDVKRRMKAEHPH